MCVFVCVYVYVYTYTLTPTRTRSQNYTKDAYTHACKHTYEYVTHIHTSTLTCKQQHEKKHTPH